MKPRIFVAGLLLVVAILTFGGLAYQTVPVNITQTMTEESTGMAVSYSAYLATSTAAYPTQFFSTSIYSQPAATVCAGLYPGACVGYPPTVITRNIPVIQTAQSTIQLQDTATISYSLTVTSSITESSTIIMAAYQTLGLNALTFNVVAITVIALLALTTVWVAKTNRPKSESETGKAAPSSNPCVECGQELPPNSKFCNNCGAKQP